MPHLLIVNDDGIASPMLAPMVAKLAPLGDVSIVVPAEEQSWKGKAMTRFGRIYARASTEFDVPAYAVTGTPSDCVNLAIHQLLPVRPDWVVSGINIGSNAGAAFVISSGTVGAALEGLLQGVPSVAFSTYLRPEYFREWNADKRLTHPHSLEIIETTTARMAAMMATLIQRGAGNADAVLNINFPGIVGPHTPVRWVPMQESRYGAVFRPDGDGFVHSAAVGLHGDEERLTDRTVILGGDISCTPLALSGLGLAPPPEAERPF
ncbi:MAG TPA: 5'/3'-nucleotidase SurE [bacterium]|nr:5'/3'-nucleotidase SurE [bacterium]